MLTRVSCSKCTGSKSKHKGVTLTTMGKEDRKKKIFGKDKKKFDDPARGR